MLIEEVQKIVATNVDSSTAYIRPAEVEYLWRICQGISNGLVIEIGTEHGMGSTFTMYQSLKGRNNRMICIDCWGGWSEVAKKQYYPRYQNYLKNLIVNDMTLSTIYDFSYRASELFVNSIADIVFIDGSHLEEDVIRDINCWKSKVKSGGVLCGHDYNMESVKRGVDPLFKNIELCASIWSVKI